MAGRYRGTRQASRLFYFAFDLRQFDVFASAGRTKEIKIGDRIDG